MKIGIMTFWWSEDNYGQLLQCYALQKYLRDNGHDAYLIRYDPRNDYKKDSIIRKILMAFNPEKLKKYLSKKKRLKIARIENKLNPRNFDNFRKLYIKQSEKIYTSYKQLKQDPPDADIYIVGSDQVWNFGNLKLEIIKNLLHAYFLDFGTLKVKRISYAASWSVTSLPKEIKTEIKPLLQKFNYVSVREETGILLCKELNVYAEWLPDPTLLHEPDVYRSLYKNIILERHKKKYLFLYLLANDSDFSIKDIFSWAESKNLDVVYVTGNNNIDNFNKVFASIQEWLFFLDNAEYVITNSFHCCVFSILFHKQFAVFPVKGNISGMNTRLESLWKLTNIPPRLLNNDYSILDVQFFEINQAGLTNKLKQLVYQINI